MRILKNRSRQILEYILVFSGDMLPYTSIFILTILVSYRLGFASVADFSLSYAYAALVTSLVCGPNLLSIRRRMPGSSSKGAVIAASLLLRVLIIIIITILLISILYLFRAKNTVIILTLMLVIIRYIETSSDPFAIYIQYERNVYHYFRLRMLIFFIVSGCNVIIFTLFNNIDIFHISYVYLFGTICALLTSIYYTKGLIYSFRPIFGEIRVQLSEFRNFFISTVIFLAATRLHPPIISFFHGEQAAGEYATINNLFSVLGVTATGVAGVFFWARNRKQGHVDNLRVPWLWIVGSIFGGLGLAVVAGLVMEWFYLRPLNTSEQLIYVSWLLCLSTPLLCIQAILSNQLILQQRDWTMLRFSAINSVISLLSMTVLVSQFGLTGASLSVSVSALTSSLIGFYVIKNQDV